MLFMKLDIAKAFDNVRWEYMLEIMERLGFGQRWCKDRWTNRGGELGLFQFLKHNKATLT